MTCDEEYAQNNGMNFRIGGRSVSAENAFNWLSGGIQIFMKAPLLWTGSLILAISFSVALSLLMGFVLYWTISYLVQTVLPNFHLSMLHLEGVANIGISSGTVGVVLSSILLTAWNSLILAYFIAVILFAAKTLRDNKPLSFLQMITGGKGFLRLLPLAFAGCILAVVLTLTPMLAILAIGASGSLVLGLLGLIIPVATIGSLGFLALLYSPALIAFHGYETIPALMASFRVARKNLVPSLLILGSFAFLFGVVYWLPDYLVFLYGVVAVFFFVVAYACYRDIYFVEEEVRLS